MLVLLCLSFLPSMSCSVAWSTILLKDMWVFNTSLVLLLNPYIYTVFPDNPGFPESSVVKNPPAVQETLLRFLGWEDLLKNG